MKILLDECLPRQLKRELVGHEARTVGDMRWLGTENGALLRRAEAQFHVFLTTDRRIPQQQNLRGIQLAFIVLVAPRIRIDVLRPLMPQVLVALQTIQIGDLVYVKTPSAGQEVEDEDANPTSPNRARP